MIFTELFENTNQPQGVSEGHADQQRKIVKRNGQPVGEVGIDRESSPGVGQYYMKHYASGTDNSGYDSREEAVEELRHLVKQGVAEGKLNEVTQGVEHNEWADNVKDAYHPTQVKIIKKRTEDGRHVKSVAMIGDKLVGQYNMNTGVGTFTAPKKQGVSEAMKPSDIPPSMRDRLTMRDIEAERPQGAFRFRVTFPDGHVNDYMTFDAAQAAADLEKGRISRLSEENKKGNPRIERILKMLRARHPQAEDDLEALIFDFRSQQARDRNDISRLDAENDAEEADIQRLEKMLDVIRQRRGAAPMPTTESLRDGEYHVATVTLDDGTVKRVRITSDEGFRDLIEKHFAKQGRKVADIDVDFSVQSNN